MPSFTSTVESTPTGSKTSGPCSNAVSREPTSRSLPGHLFRYLDERVFTYNQRKASGFGRFVSVLAQTAGRRLTFDQLTGKTPVYTARSFRFFSSAL